MKIKKITLACAFTLVAFCSSAFAASLEQVKKDTSIKNVIVIIADGMSVGGITLTRWYNAYDEKTGKVDVSKPLALDELASGLVRTWWENDGVIGAITDSAPAATAMSTGIKTNNKFIGVNDKKAPLATILEAAKLQGKATGLVATSQMMHATPAGYSSHTPDRSQEYNIAEQQVYNNLDVVLGSGYKRLQNRPDKEDLTVVLKENGYSYITKTTDLANINSKTWGMFAEMDLAYEMDRVENKLDQPSLADMTKKAIDVLSKNKNGFFMMVEASKIDWAAHANDPIGLISDINAFDAAVKVALDFAKQNNETILIVSTDHGNGGITMGDKETTGTYDKDPLSKFIVPLKKAKLTGEGLNSKFNSDRSNIKEVMAQYYGIDDLTSDEEKAIKEAEAGKMNYVVGPMISKRAYLGWTTGGHTGEDVVLYTYLPNNDRLTGTVVNTDFAKLNAAIWNIDLGATTKALYNNAKTAFEAKGAKVEIDKNDEANPVMKVSKDSTTITIPESKNYVLVNDKKQIVKGVNVQIEDNFYVSDDVLALIK